MSVGLLFSPQGSQVLGMGRALAEVSPAAAAVYLEADGVLGWPISAVCWEGPAERLDDTRQTQPCLVTTSIACLAALRERRAIEPALVAGHSVGEYAALVAAGSLALSDALRLVALRGQLMANAASDGGMLAVIGLERSAVAAALDDVAGAGELVVANDNAPGQIVVSGRRDALAAAEERLRAAGARRLIPLNVSGPFHSPLMEPLAGPLADAFDEVTWHPARPPLVSNVSAEPVSDPPEIRRLLGRQVSSPVEWVASVRRMAAAGVDLFIECGPGNALTGMVRRILPQARTASVSDPSGLDAVVEALAATHAGIA
ncbi:MAG: ACP S-malonyltransferase [Chloroflexota bacterium]|nr:ACP S-malonyltransferase [Chloroflexota bacterium]